MYTKTIYNFNIHILIKSKLYFIKNKLALKTYFIVFKNKLLFVNQSRMK